MTAPERRLSLVPAASCLIINRLEGGMPASLASAIEKMEITLLGTIPADQALSDFEFSGRPLVELGDDSPVYQAVERMMVEMLGVRSASAAPGD